MDSQNEENLSPNNDRWMVSYADFMTLMFALFTVLYATSTRDVEKTEQFQKSIKQFMMKAGVIGSPGEKIGEGQNNSNPIEQPIQTFAQTNPALQETFDEAEKFIEENLTEDERKKYVLDLSNDELGVRLVLVGTKVFANNLAQFRPEAVAFIDKLADLIGKLGRRVIVEGHVAEPNKNQMKYPSAWEFAGARATVFVRYMISRHKIAAQQFTPISYGNERPVTSGKNQNDRLELVILTDGVPL